MGRIDAAGSLAAPYRKEVHQGTHLAAGNTCFEVSGVLQSYPDAGHPRNTTQHFQTLGERQKYTMYK